MLVPKNVVSLLKTNRIIHCTNKYFYSIFSLSSQRTHNGNVSIFVKTARRGAAVGILNAINTLLQIVSIVL